MGASLLALAKSIYYEFNKQAGIVSKDNPNQLIIALEPEAAAVFCWEKKLSQLENHNGVEAKDSDLPKPGNEYMVVDSGGELHLFKFYTSSCNCVRLFHVAFFAYPHLIK